MLVTKVTRPMHFDRQFGNYVPAEIENGFVCDYCSHTLDYEPEDVKSSMMCAPWKYDCHICEDCMEVFIEECINDEYDEEQKIFICPECGDEFQNRTDFHDHLLDEMVLEEE